MNSIAITQEQLKNALESDTGWFSRSGDTNFGFLLDQTWIVEDALTKEDAINQKPYDLSRAFVGMDVTYILEIKNTILRRFKHSDEVIFCKFSTFTETLSALIRFQKALNKLDISSLSQITEENKMAVYRAMLYQDDGSLYAPRSLKRSFMLLQDIYIRSQNEYVADAPKVQMTFLDFKTSVKELVEKEWSKGFKDWVSGGSLGGFPIELGVVTFDEALKEVNEKQNLCLIHAIYKAVEEFSKHTDIERKNSKYIRAALKQLLNELFRRSYTFKHDEYKSIVKRTRLGIEQEYEISIAEDASTKRFITTVYQTLQSEGIDLLTIELPDTCGELNTIIRHKLLACLVALSLLSGGRKSELRSLTCGSFNRDSVDNATFISDIQKTNHSISTERAIATIGYDIGMVAISLQSPINLDGTPMTSEELYKRPLYRVMVPWLKSDIVASFASERLGIVTFKSWVLSALERRVSDLDELEVPNPTTHRFRHVWVEMALRRFDGNVPEAIRNHLRHAFGSFMTMEYLKEKCLKEMPELSRNYIRELLGRAANEHEEFFGPVGRFISEHLQQLEVITDENIEVLLDEFDVIEPHDYGYCMIRKSHKTQAKCFDKTTQSPQYDSAKWEHCGGCVGSLRMPNHRDAIMRIGQREAELKTSREALGLKALSKQSNKTLKLCESAIKDIDKLIPLINIT
jgi:integrase